MDFDSEKVQYKLHINSSTTYKGPAKKLRKLVSHNAHGSSKSSMLIPPITDSTDYPKCNIDT